MYLNGLFRKCLVSLSASNKDFLCVMANVYRLYAQRKSSRDQLRLIMSCTYFLDLVQQFIYILKIGKHYTHCNNISDTSFYIIQDNVAITICLEVLALSSFKSSNRSSLDFQGLQQLISGYKYRHQFILVLSLVYIPVVNIFFHIQ